MSLHEEKLYTPKPGTLLVGISVSKCVLDIAMGRIREEDITGIYTARPGATLEQIKRADHDHHLWPEELREQCNSIAERLHSKGLVVNACSKPFNPLKDIGIDVKAPPEVPEEFNRRQPISHKYGHWLAAEPRSQRDNIAVRNGQGVNMAEVFEFVSPQQEIKEGFLWSASDNRQIYYKEDMPRSETRDNLQLLRRHLSHIADEKSIAAVAAPASPPAAGTSGPVQSLETPLAPATPAHAKL